MKNYFVYQHIRKDTGTVFYIGLGKLRKDRLSTTVKLKHYRAYSKQGRNPIWKAITNKSSYKVEIIKTNISKKEAVHLEISLIQKYGKIKNGGVLSNISDGGETVLPELITVLNDSKCSQMVYQYNLKGNFLKEWLSTNQIKRELGYDNSVIRKSLLGKTKSPNISYGYQWYLEYKGDKIDAVAGGKTTLHRAVRLYNNEENLIFNSREECGKYFNVASCQITNALRGNYKFKEYNVENYDTN